MAVCDQGYLCEVCGGDALAGRAPAAAGQVSRVPRPRPSAAKVAAVEAVGVEAPATPPCSGAKSSNRGAQQERRRQPGERR